MPSVFEENSDDDLTVNRTQISALDAQQNYLRLWTMRLLYHDDAGKVRLTEDLLNGNIPRYAILSHTWGSEEVVFADIKDSTGESKTGFAKIKFCGHQAQLDGLKYFWVDICCIEKSNNTELQEVINSMFRWYHRAAKCYVYLADVSTRTPNDQSSWIPAFWVSRWFTRG
ncbi:heterokaryon incompatibility protein-domain-containing protein [Podospora didyma]|uniref:Heterokaryon incompatibility protein-domain-containing protein n=1 Tax=Podospora didyma TaxID=330526 RepID=A0AAE0NGR5_9PEZI|nr:heterokaryon incompatibility protein-domain-containing protein [Podospora didyma]